MTETRWWWIRHAPVPNPSNRIYGARDLPCDTSDAAVFASLSERLPAKAAWITSHLQRTHQTAAAILAAAGRAATPDVEPDFAEQNFGDWQGKTYAEIGAFGHVSGPNGHKLWLTAATVTPPGGESFVDVLARVGAAIERVGAAHAGRDLIVVAHGGTIRAALGHALGLSPEAALAFQVANCSLTRIDRIAGPGAGHGWRVATVNQMP